MSDLDTLQPPPDAPPPAAAPSAQAAPLPAAPPEIFATPDDLGEPRASQLHVPWDLQWKAEAAQAFLPGVREAYNIGEYSRASAPTLDDAIARMNAGDTASEWALRGPAHGVGTLHDFATGQSAPPPPEVPIEAARAQVKAAGLEGAFKLPDQPVIRQGVLDLMIRDAQDKRAYDAAIARGPQGFLPGALGFVTQVGLGLIDPINDAAFMVPVAGEARTARLLASAGESVLARSAVRFGVGALQGAAGSAALEPADWWLHTLDGQDYTYADTLRSIVMGAAMGGTFHTLGGAYGDLRARLRGLPLPGSPEDLLARGLMQGTHVPGETLSDAGVPLEELPGIAGPRAAAPAMPADVVADLPPPVRNDLLHAAAADVMHDVPGRAGEVLAIAAQQDPRIAESAGIDAWHGSPHDFAAFSDEAIGTGEGAASYGHGHYLAENEAVGASYRAALSRDVVDWNDPHAIASYFLDGANGDREEALLNSKLHVGVQNWDALNEAQRLIGSGEKIAASQAGTLYRVKIHADPDHFLDWDEPLDQQSEHVRRALAPLLERARANRAQKLEGIKRGETAETAAESAIRGEARPDAGGDVVYHVLQRDLGSAQAASEALRDAGVRGIKYLDQGSRPVNKIGNPIPPEVLADLKAVGYLGFDRPGQALAALREDVRAGRDIRKTWDLGRPEEAELAQRLEDYAKRPLVEEPPQQTRNFVVFDPKDIEITHKNGEPVRQAELPPRAHTLSADAREWPAPPEGARIAGSDDHGPVLEGLAGRWGEAVDWLRKAQTGDARGVLEHPDVPGPIDVIWGEQRPSGEGYGLAHIAALHPEVLPDLPERLARMRPFRVGPNRIQLTDGESRAIVRLDFEGKRKIWLLTAFELPGRGEERTETPAGLPGPDRSPSPPDGGNVARRSGDLNAWRELAAPHPDPERDAVAEASRAADKEPEPASVDPVKAPSAAEAEAAKAEAALKELDPFLSDEERTRVRDALAAMDADRDAQERIIRDGAACLMAAAA